MQVQGATIADRIILPVIFGAPGTLVTSNTVITLSRIGLGAINMVDYGPRKPRWTVGHEVLRSLMLGRFLSLDDGNYMNTRVIHNTIRIDGSYLRIGIGQGDTVWFTPPPPDKPRKYNRGATVMYNLITTGSQNQTNRPALGYGFPVSDVDDWICTKNEVSSTVVVGGDMSRMSRDPRSLNIGPGAFVCSPSTTEGQGPRNSSLQTEFVTGPIRRLIDIEPGASSYRVFCPGQLCLAMGQSLALAAVELSFDWDGEVRLKKTAVSGESDMRKWQEGILWMAHSGGKVGETTTANLLLDSSSGKLVIVDQGRVLFDITPVVPGHSSTSSTAEELVMIISDTQPYLVIASIVTGSILWAPTGYRVGYQWQISRGPYVSQTTSNGQNTLLSTLNPLGQYVVLQMISGLEISETPPSWPLDETKWKVVWKSHEVKHDAEPDGETRIIFQGDGNLVRLHLFCYFS